MFRRKAALIFLTLAVMSGLAVAGALQGPGVGWASYHEDTSPPLPPEPAPPPVVHDLTVSPAAVCPGESISFSGEGAPAGTSLSAYLQQGSAGMVASTTLFVGLGSFTATDDGYESTGTVPATLNVLTDSDSTPYGLQPGVAACYSSLGDPIITTPAGEWTVMVYDPQGKYEAAGSFTVLNCSVAPDNTPITPDTLPASLPSTGTPSLPMTSAGLLLVAGAMLMAAASFVRKVIR